VSKPPKSRQMPIQVQSFQRISDSPVVEVMARPLD
jgi:hypothetical protein